MTETSPLRRKIGATRREPKPAPQTPDRIWRRALVHGWTQALGVEVGVAEVAGEKTTPDAVGDLVDEGCLIALLDSEAGHGLALVSFDLVAALVEAQTLGRLRRTRPEPRVPTVTDAALVSDPLDRMLSLHDGMARELDQPCPVTGFRFATPLARARDIAPALTDAAHMHWRMEVELGPDAARGGALHLILPDRPQLPSGRDRPCAEGWRRRMDTRVMGSELLLTAELARLTVSLDEVRGLKVGERLTLPRRAVQMVAIRTAGGASVGSGRLGQSDGRKAVRIEAAPDDAFVEVAAEPGKPGEGPPEKQ